MSCFFLEATAFAKLFVRESGTDALIRLMEEMRLNYGRAYRTGYVWDLIHGKARRIEPSDEPMPIDLKAYIIAREYHPNKRTFGKIIPELVKHKDELHPFMRRYLLEQLRDSESGHRKLAESYQAIADQFEINEQPRSVNRDIATV